MLIFFLSTLKSMCNQKKREKLRGNIKVIENEIDELPPRPHTLWHIIIGRLLQHFQQTVSVLIAVAFVRASSSDTPTVKQ